jgi:tetratricopeptide (TPR) repeat protein
VAPGQAGELPPGHPAELPPGHPAIGSTGAAPELPSGHPQVTPGQAAPSAEDLLRKLDENPELKKKEKPFEISVSLSKLYAANGRYDDARDFLLQAMKKAGTAPRPAALEARVLLAQSLFLTGDRAGAMAEYKKALVQDAEYPEALYGHAGLLIEGESDDLPTLKTARRELSRFLELRPDSPRTLTAHRLLAEAEEAIAAGGMRALKRKRQAEGPKPAAVAPPMAAQGPYAAAGASGGTQDAPPALSPQVMQAMQSTPITPEREAEFGKILDQGEEHLARGRYQEALDSFKQVMPYRPDGRVRAGMAWSLVGLGRPMADRIWGVAISSDASAVDKLGDTLAQKGDATGARALWKKLAESAPDYASQSGLARKLR